MNITLELVGTSLKVTSAGGSVTYNANDVHIDAVQVGVEMHIYLYYENQLIYSENSDNVSVVGATDDAGKLAFFETLNAGGTGGGDASVAKQDAIIDEVHAIGEKLMQGQGTMAQSLSVVVASNQGDIHTKDDDVYARLGDVLIALDKLGAGTYATAPAFQLETAGFSGTGNVLEKNDARRGLILQNTSEAYAVWVAFSGSASNTNSFRLAPYERVIFDKQVYTDDVTAFCLEGDVIVNCIEINA